MAILRLVNGGDLSVRLSVDEVLAALSSIGASVGEREFVALPGEDGPVHLRPAAVLAVLDEQPRHTPGFRPSAPPRS